MTQVAIFTLNKYKESPDQLEKRINAWIESTGDVSLLSASENIHNGDIVFVFQSHGEKKSIAQELCLIAWSDLDKLEGAVNNALQGLEETGRRARYINFVTSAKSPRALAVFVVEGNRYDPTSSVPEPSNADDSHQDAAEEKKQDEAANAKPKRQRKSKSVG